MLVPPPHPIPTLKLQLTGVTILNARDLLKVICAQVKSLYLARTESGWSRDLNSHILFLAVRVASNVLLALENNQGLFTSAGQQSRMYASITRDVLQVINNLVQVSLSNHIPLEFFFFCLSSPQCGLGLLPTHTKLSYLLL